MPWRDAGDLRAAPLLILAAVALTHPAVAAPEPGVRGEAFRSSARAFLDCLDEQSRVSYGRRDDAMTYAERIYAFCAEEIEAFAEAAQAGRAGRRSRAHGAIRAAITDSVIGYEARDAFRR